MRIRADCAVRVVWRLSPFFDKIFAWLCGWNHSNTRLQSHSYNSLGLQNILCFCFWEALIISNLWIRKSSRGIGPTGASAERILRMFVSVLVCLCIFSIKFTWSGTYWAYTRNSRQLCRQSNLCFHVEKAYPSRFQVHEWPFDKLGWLTYIFCRLIHQTFFSNFSK